METIQSENVEVKETLENNLQQKPEVKDQHEFGNVPVASNDTQISKETDYNTQYPPFNNIPQNSPSSAPINSQVPLEQNTIRQVEPEVIRPAIIALEEGIYSGNTQNDIKVNVVGESNVGKTSFLSSFYPRENAPVPVATVGEEYHRFSCAQSPSENIILQFWDTSGNDQFRSGGEVFYEDTKAVLLCFSLADRNSFNQLLYKWYYEIIKFTQYSPYLVVVGLKSDLRESRQLDFNTIQQGLNNIGLTTGDYFECSAKEKKDLTFPLLRLVEKLRNRKNEPVVDTKESDDYVYEYNEKFAVIEEWGEKIANSAVMNKLSGIKNTIDNITNNDEFQNKFEECYDECCVIL